MFESSFEWFIHTELVPRLNRSAELIGRFPAGKRFYENRLLLYLDAALEYWLLVRKAESDG